MTRPLSMDIRDCAMTPLDAGETVREAAEALSVAPSSVVKGSQRRRTSGSAASGKIGGRRPHKIQGEHETWLRARMAEARFRGCQTNANSSRFSGKDNLLGRKKPTPRCCQTNANSSQFPNWATC